MIFRGEWLFRWGPDGKDGEVVGRAGDIMSIPTWIFRGFTNIGPDDSWIFTALGRDVSGGVIWDPAILRGAAEQGLYLRRDNMLVDTSTGAPKPRDDELIHPLTPEFIATMRRYSVEEMKARLVTAEERKWSDRALLDTVLPGHGSALAPAIGPGMSQDRNASPKITNPHGFSIEWLRIEPGQVVGPFRIAPKQVAILQQGAAEISIGMGDDASTVTAHPWDTFAFPAEVWRTLRSVGEEPALMTLTTAGDARAVIEWAPEIVAGAWAAGYGLDPNDYIAVAEFLPAETADAVAALS